MAKKVRITRTVTDAYGNSREHIFYGELYHEGQVGECVYVWTKDRALGRYNLSRFQNRKLTRQTLEDVLFPAKHKLFS